jgi:16S rRNA (cytidine1402-2'-O)-methyltransferase
MAKLYIIPTPIGNLKDITLRALEYLEQTELILAEDTRITQKLLSHYNIKKPLIPYHKFNEHKNMLQMIEKIQSLNHCVLVSDAGTPSISDPGFMLIRECIANGIEIECLPGATALIPALVNSGLPSDRFIFEGFLPQKKGRQTRIKLLAEEERTVILYESPFRLVKALEQLSEFFGSERKASVSRELSKMFEENARGTLSELISHFKSKTVKGEVVIVIEGRGRNQEE